MSKWDKMVEAGTCPTCGMKYQTKDELEKHHKEKHGMPGYVDVVIAKMDEAGDCPTCGIKYTSKDELKAHMDEHHGMPGYVDVAITKIDEVHVTV